ncbi:unnamed protein product, partial [Rotaria magnacalcarata]
MYPCKIPVAFAQAFGLMSQIIICFAAIDPLMSTLLHKSRQRFSIELMQHLIIMANVISISILYGIPFRIYYDTLPLSGTNATTCVPNENNELFSEHIVYVGFLIINDFLPLTIMNLFGLLTFQEQLTAMVLIKILNVCITVIPFLVFPVIRYIVSSCTNDTIIQKQIQLLNRVFTMLFFVNFAENFYIFVASSSRFRQQLKYVLINIHFKGWCAKTNVNRVHPVVEGFELPIT